MANQEKKIRMGVDAQGVETDLKRMRSAAEELARGLIDDARKYSTSSREVLQDIEEQIKAIEKRNRLESEGRKVELEMRRDAGTIGQESYKTQVGALGREAREDKLQVQLLRELIETIKTTAKEEIRERRTEVEKRLQESRSVDRLAPDGDQFEVLKETVQKQELGRIQQEEIQQRDNFHYGRQGINVMSRMGSASNVYESAMMGAQGMAQGAAGSGSRIISAGGLAMGAALALGINAIRASMPYEQAVSAAYGASGQTFMDSPNLSSLGYTRDEVINRRVALSRASGQPVSSQEVTNSMIMQRGMGIDEGVIDQLARTGRGDISGVNDFGIVSGMVGGMERSGAASGGNLNLLPEYLNVLVGLGQEQVKRLGSVDLGVNTKMITAISELDDSFRNPDVLSGLIQTLYGGLTGASTPQQEAMQYSVLSRINPGASMFELMKMRENPFSEESSEYLPRYLDMIKGRSGGNEDLFFMSLMDEFGLSSNMAERLGRGYMAGGESFDKMISDEFRPQMSVDAGERAGSGVGTLMSSTAAWTSSMQKIGMDITDVMSGVATGIGNLINEVQDIKNSVQGMDEGERAAFRAFLKEMPLQFSGLARVLEKII